jgi:hypothetical protein
MTDIDLDKTNLTPFGTPFAIGWLLLGVVLCSAAILDSPEWWDTILDGVILLAWLFGLGIAFAIIMYGFHYSINGMARCLFSSKELKK